MPKATIRLGRLNPFKPFFILLVLILLMGLAASSGYYYAFARLNLNPAEVTSASPTGTKVDFGVFWQAWKLLDTKSFHQPDNTKRLDGAISGMTASIGDPYTVYLAPTESNLFQSQLEGSFGGIGAELVVRNQQLVVSSPLDGSPAEKAGLKAQDIITEIDGQKVADLNFNAAIAKIRGTKGTTVTLTLVRPASSDQPFKLTITRDTITVKSVKTESIGPDTSIAYVKVNEFGADTTSLFRAALQDAKSANKKGLVIDLRNDPGGYLDSAVAMVGMLIPDSVQSDQAKLKNRVAVLVRSKDGTEQAQSSHEAAILDTLPVVVVVNGGSASASEIFSGALRDYGRAKLVGAKTFGKGSVQDLTPLTNGGTMKITIAKWFTPLGTGIDGSGLQPDISVDLPDGQTISSSDAQITRALQVLADSSK